MTRPKFTEAQKGQISTLLALNWSYGAIIQRFKREGVSITKGYLSVLKNKKENLCKKKKKKKELGRPPLLSNRQKAGLKKRVMNVNPPTHRTLAAKYNVSPNTIRYTIKKSDLRKVKKPKCHSIPPNSVQKRAARAKGLYNLLRNDQWKNIITSDEAMFYCLNTNEKRDVQYLTPDQKRSSAEPFTHRSHPPSLMVWIGISHHGVTEPIFVKPGAKINSQYYVDNVLQPLYLDAKRLYPEGNFKFHQDSAPSHTAKKTLQNLKDNNIDYITPNEWMPNSPDAAPCDYFLWGYLKKKVMAHKIETLRQLEFAIRAELKLVPQEFIDNALRSWPERCLMIHRAKGGHIEKF